MSGTKCGGCGNYISPRDGALTKCRCGKCKALYHRACVGITNQTIITAQWRCPECKKDLARDNGADTPVRGHLSAENYISPTTSSNSNLSTPLQSASPPVHATPPKSDEAALETSQIAGNNMAAVIMAELRAVRAEIQDFRKEMEQEMSELKTSMGICNTRINSLEARVDALEQRASVSPANTGSADKIVEDLRRELNDRDQDLLANDIEISNVPEDKVDNPSHLIKTISIKLGVTLEERDIVSAERVGRRHINATNSAGPTESRPRAIVVRLSRRDLRDELLANARVRRGMTTADLSLTGPTQRFYINERLTKSNRQLFRRARDAAALRDWRFVWTKRGRILVRRKPGDQTHRIRSEDDITRIFGSVNDTV